MLDPLSSQDVTVFFEGRTRLCAPSPKRVPAMLPAFFNPRGKFVRDVSIACYDAFSKRYPSRGRITFADALAGVGARGIRVANEVSGFSAVFLNDVNTRALEYARASIASNSLESKCFISKLEANAFLETRSSNAGDRFDVVDIDPFGTPSPYIESAIRATKDGGLLSLAATDSAVLCGVYPKVAQRKYGGVSIRTDYSHEIGMRLVMGLLAQGAMRLETGIEPIFCHHDMHYFRVYCKINVGNAFSRKNQDKMGFVLHCFHCGYRSLSTYSSILPQSTKDTAVSKVCPNCLESENRNTRLVLGGPLWAGTIQSSDFVADCAKVSEFPLFHIGELDIPLYYDLTVLSRKNGSRTPKLVDVMNGLIELGFATSRTRLNPNALRTLAPIQVLRSIVSELAR
jgi:tRNA (guanine26-N2/guanine27-N2)-dimethyltransferase